MDVEKTLDSAVGPRKAPWNKLELEDGALSSDRLREYQERIFRNLADRTGLIFNTREFRDLQKSYVFPEPTPTAGSDSTIRIVTISPSLRVNLQEDGLGELEGNDLVLRRQRDGCKTFVPGERVSPEQWIKDRVAELESALEKEPHVICYSELCYPPPAQDEIGWSVEGIQRAAVGRRDFNEEIRTKLAKFVSKGRPGAPKPFVFLGSYHCPYTLYNVGVILPAGDSENLDFLLKTEGFGSAGPTTREGRTAAPIYYRKRFPAQRVGERTRVPPTQDLDVFYMPFGRVGVIICSDVVDLNQFYRFAKLSQGGEGVDLLLVPSMNRSTKHVSMCQELSHWANTTVAAVNITTDGINLPETDIFCCGLDVHQIAQLSETTKDFTDAVKSDARWDVSDGARRTAELRLFTLDAVAMDSLRKAVPAPKIPGLEPSITDASY